MNLLRKKARQVESYERKGRQTMSDLQQNAVIKLMSSPHYKELAAYESPFNPFEIVGATHLELIHSSVLAWLLKDETNKEFRQKFVICVLAWLLEDEANKKFRQRHDTWITWIKNNIVAKAETEESLIRLQSVLEDPIVKTEEGDQSSRYDISVCFKSLKLVIGIEVKVWAPEKQPDQVKKYQNLLCEKYPDPHCKRAKVLVFLTPKGQKPTTADENKEVDVPVLAMSWGCVSDIIREMRATLGNENDFRMQFSQHIERNIIIIEKEEQRIVRKLLSEGDNEKILDKIIDERPSDILSESDAETLDKIIKNMPLQGYSAQWKKIVAEVCGVKEGNLEVKTYPQGGIVRELKIRIPEWSKAGLPFTVMLHKYQNADAGVRILLYTGHYPKDDAELKKFANHSNDVVDDKFSPLTLWDWRSVLTKDEANNEPEHTLIDNIWSEGWEEKVKNRLREQIGGSGGLLEQINEWIKTKGANKG